MANKSVEVILNAVKSAGEAALRLQEENERLRGLLWEADQLVASCCDCISRSGTDLQARIDAALSNSREETLRTADQPPEARDPRELCAYCLGTGRIPRPEGLPDTLPETMRCWCKYGRASDPTEAV